MWQAFPYLLVGAGRWDLDMTVYGGVHERHGRIGAPGTVFRIITLSLGAKNRIAAPRPTIRFYNPGAVSLAADS